MTKKFCDCCDHEIVNLDEALVVEYTKTISAADLPPWRGIHPLELAELKKPNEAIFCKDCLPVVVKILRPSK